MHACLDMNGIMNYFNNPIVMFYHCAAQIDSFLDHRILLLNFLNKFILNSIALSFLSEVLFIPEWLVLVANQNMRMP